MRPPKSNSPQEPVKPSKALGNVFAVPEAPKDQDELKAGPPIEGKDDASVEVSETPSGTIQLNDLGDPDAIALKEASDGAQLTNGPAITGTQDGMFAAFDQQDEAPAEAASSASKPAEEVLRMGFIQELNKFGITLDPDIKFTKNEMDAFLNLLKHGRWPWTDDLMKLKRKLTRFFVAAFHAEVTQSMPNFEKENASALAKELVKFLRAKDLRAVANRVEQGMPKSLKAGPPPLPPDSKK
ncbi:MAG: hypothetical protein PHC70_00525 [Patescibacteria group bacterium]|nr:hypothetical protein [Patescibacteria group bacterium]